jgi:hypothetical protein
MCKYLNTVLIKICGTPDTMNWHTGVPRHASFATVPQANVSVESHRGMISTGVTPDSSTRALRQSYRQSYLAVKREKLAKEIMNFALWSISFVLEGSFNMAKNLTTWVRQLYFPSKKKACCGFLSLSAGFEHANLGSNGSSSVSKAISPTSRAIWKKKIKTTYKNL